MNNKLLVDSTSRYCSTYLFVNKLNKSLLTKVLKLNESHFDHYQGKNELNESHFDHYRDKNELNESHFDFIMFTINLCLLLLPFSDCHLCHCHHYSYLVPLPIHL